MINPYQKLWESALIRLLLDSLGYSKPTFNETDKKVSSIAKNWLNASFIHICDLADKSPLYILKIYRKIHDKIKKEKDLQQDQVANISDFYLHQNNDELCQFFIVRDDNDKPNLVMVYKNFQNEQEILDFIEE